MDSIPIWFVILSRDTNNGFVIWHVTKSIPAVFGDIQKLSEQELMPLYNAGGHMVQPMIIARDVENPFNTLVPKNEPEPVRATAAVREPSVWDI